MDVFRHFALPAFQHRRAAASIVRRNFDAGGQLSNQPLGTNKWGRLFHARIICSPAEGGSMADAEPLVRDRELKELKQPAGLLSVLGPGLITGASDDDPSGIATYSQAGAQFGFGMGWVMLFSWPLMCAIQEISARIGRVTGRGIAGNLKQHYPAPLLFGSSRCWWSPTPSTSAPTSGAMAAALKLVIGGPQFCSMSPLFAVVSLLLEVFVRYSRVRLGPQVADPCRCSPMSASPSSVHVPWADGRATTSSCRRSCWTPAYLTVRRRDPRHDHQPLPVLLAGGGGGRGGQGARRRQAA